MSRTFTLKNIIPIQVEQLFGIELVCNRNSVNAGVTPVTPITPVTIPPDHHDRHDNLTSQHRCWWDHHPLTDTHAIQLPIQFCHQYSTTTYESYTMKTVHSDIDRNRVQSNPIEYHTSRFCSLACAMAYLHTHTDSIIFHHTPTLLHYIGVDATPAPHWSRLVEYGGDLTIHQFRKMNH